MQAHSVDLGSPNAIKIASSNGRAVTVLMPNLTNVVKTTRLYGFNVGPGATNPNAIYAETSPGHAAVTEFTY